MICCEYCGTNTDGIILHLTIVITDKHIDYDKAISVCMVCYGILGRLQSDDKGRKKLLDEKIQLYSIKSKSFPTIKKEKVIPFYNSLIVPNHMKGKKVVKVDNNQVKKVPKIK